MKKDKLFIVRKYVMASSARQAIRRERDVEPAEVWIDDDWLKATKERPEELKGTRIGF